FSTFHSLQEERKVSLLCPTPLVFDVGAKAGSTEQPKFAPPHFCSGSVLTHFHEGQHRFRVAVRQPLLLSHGAIPLRHPAIVNGRGPGGPAEGAEKQMVSVRFC